MSKHNHLVWDDFLLCIGMELAYNKNGENPINEQKIAEKILSLGGHLWAIQQIQILHFATITIRLLFIALSELKKKLTTGTQSIFDLHTRTKKRGKS